MLREVAIAVCLALAGCAISHGPAPAKGAAAEIPTLVSALERSCAGRRLLSALAGETAAGVDVGLSLLTGELERQVELRTGMLVDGADPRLLDSARALKRLPSGFACSEQIAVMALIDEWAARATGTDATRERSERFIEKLRVQRQAPAEGYDAWVRGRFPKLWADASGILEYLT